MRGRSYKSLFWEEEGFSTVGMALALLLTLALIFTAAQVYEVNTASAQTQEVSDAAALAAENTVGEFYIVVSVCDAVALSLSLTMLVSLGLGVVCACIPPTAELSASFIKASDEIRKARDKFCDSAQESLQKLASALPFIATARAQQVLAANSQAGINYQGVVVLAPWESDEGDAPEYSKSDDALDEAESSQDELTEAAEKAEKAAKEANKWKKAAYEADSGSKTEYCMYERASKLAEMQGLQNPFFSSVDTWNFSAALDRAQAYYRNRFVLEEPEGATAEQKADSALRERFYVFAQLEINKGYVHETDDSFDAYFPTLPKNTEEMEKTSLFTEEVYLKTKCEKGDLKDKSDQKARYILHAYDECPNAVGRERLGRESIAQMKIGGSDYGECAECRFIVSSMGTVASATSSVESGFECHYLKVAEAAEKYQKAREELDPLKGKVKELAGGLFDSIGESIKEAVSQRISIEAPGRYGAVCLVAATGAPASRFSSSFVNSQGASALGMRVALSSATLVKEESDEGKNVITSFMDGLNPSGSGGSGATRILLDAWSALLGVYTQGQEALKSALEDGLGSIPLFSASGLGTWAADALDEAIADVGFEPPDLRARKAVVVNSAHVAAQDESSFAAQLLSLKSQAVQAGGAGGVAGALSAVEQSGLEAISGLGEEFQIATVSLLDGAVEIPITIALPASVTGGLTQAFQQGMAVLSGAVASVTGERQWR